MNKILWTALASAALAVAQQAGGETILPKIIPVHYVNVMRLQQLVNIPGVNVKADEQMRVLVVSGKPDAVSAIEEMVKKLDVPPPAEPRSPDFELTAYLIAGTPQAKPDDVPAELSGAVKQLHGLFPYKSYHVLDIFVLRGAPQNGFAEAATSGILPGTTANYDFFYNSANVLNSNPRTVHLTRMGLRIDTPLTYRTKEGDTAHRTVEMNSNIDIPEGQKVVVGKSNFTGGDDAIILVLSAKIIE